MKSINTRYFYLLDLARFFAACSVLVWHYVNFGEIRFSQDTIMFKLFDIGFTRGFLAVQFFWILSGFVITNVYFNDWPGIGKFARHRIARLYPLHLITLLVITSLGFISLTFLGTTNIVGDFDLKHFLIHLLFLPGFFTAGGHSFNGVIWSVSLEISSYFLFCILMTKLRDDYKRSRVFAIRVILLMICLVILDFSRGFPDLVVRVNYYFFAGVLSFFAFQRLKGNRKLSGLVAILFYFSIMLLERVLARENMSRWFQVDQLRVLAILAPIVFLLALFEPSKISRSFTRLASSLGELTYSLYLCHYPLQVSTLILCALIKVPIEELARSWFFFLLFYLLVFMVARTTHKKIELPLRKRIRNRR